MVAEELDALNRRIMNRVNDSGDIFLSHTQIDGVFTLRIAIGNIRTERRHIERAWDLLQAAAWEEDGADA